MNRTAFAMLAALGLVFSDAGSADDYQSPYRLQLTIPEGELIGDILGERGDPKRSSRLPFHEWYTRKTEHAWGSWGPPQRHYPAPNLPRHDAEFKRQRVLAIAARYIGYSYQHHHIPDWDPPANWAWKEVKSGRNGKGVDCSNFTTFVYNLGFGIRPSAAIGKQAEATSFPGPNDELVFARKIELPPEKDQLSTVLRPGDLLFIRGKPEGEVTHVVLWVGRYGAMADGSPSDKPLIMDSHGQGVHDANGNPIPNGIHLRPFAPGSWYFKCASHAHRIFPD